MNVYLDCTALGTLKTMRPGFEGCARTTPVLDAPRSGEPTTQAAPAVECRSCKTRAMRAQRRMRDTLGAQALLVVATLDLTRMDSHYHAALPAAQTARIP